MNRSASPPDDSRNERPRRWFFEQGIVGIGVSVIMGGAHLLGIDQILILWAGLAGNTQAQGVVRFVFTDLMPVFLVVSGFGLYLVGRGLTLDGQTGQITARDSWVAGFFGLLLVGYLLSLLV